MLKRVAAAAVVALLVLVVAITPLSAALQSGYFELWVSTYWQGPSTHVVLFDDTTLVSAFVASEPGGFDDHGMEPTSGPTRSLTFWWLGGCGDSLIQVHFYPTGDGFGLHERTETNGCQFLDGISRSFTLLLRAPIDASTVIFTGTDVVTREP